MESLELFAKEVMPEFKERHHWYPEVAGAAARQAKIPGEQLDPSGVASGGHAIAKPTDITDPFVQTALVMAEQAFDAGDCLRTVRKCVDE